MRKVEICLIAILALALCAATITTRRSGRQQRPNILFCFADDWGRYASIFAALEKQPSPNQVVKTPNIDRVAREGALFRRAFVSAPSCTPCRSALLSGRYFFKDMKVEAFYPDGRREVVFSAPDYSFNWQTTYVLKRPQPFPKGTRLFTVAHFDNSAKNKLNPDPGKTIRWGEPSGEEMMGLWIEYVKANQSSSAPSAPPQRARP